MYIASKNDLKILVRFCFDESPGWFGGKARSMQLRELFEKEGFTFEKINFPGINKWQIGIGFLKYFFKHGYFRPFSRASIYCTGKRYAEIRWIIQQYPDIKAGIFEGTGYGDLVLTSILSDYSKKTIFIPANVESLAEYTDMWTHKHFSKINRLKQEVKYYSKAAAVFCISEEEAWLLRVFGSEAYFLPYFTPDCIQERMNKIKQARRPDPEFGYFAFASYGIPHTKGLQTLISSIEKGKFGEKKIKIAGYGLPQNFHEKVKHLKNVEILYALEDAKFDECLAKCESALLIHSPTSGMITRTPDMLLLGIPIIGNEDAIRSYVFCKGANLVEFKNYNFENTSQLLENKKNEFYSYFWSKFYETIDK
jgi:hypothetical protein